SAVEEAGGVSKEFNTIAVDDGIAMGHGGMLYSLPSRDLIADSIEYMVNAHTADALVCISNCDKITPGHLMAAMRLNIPVIFVSGGPSESGKPVEGVTENRIDLVDAMSLSANDSITDAQLAEVEENACPTCGSCSGMFTANSINCPTQALGLSLPGNGTTLATHAFRRELFLQAGRDIVELAQRHYEEGHQSAPPRSRARSTSASTTSTASRAWSRPCPRSPRTATRTSRTSTVPAASPRSSASWTGPGCWTTTSTPSTPRTSPAGWPNGTSVAARPRRRPRRSSTRLPAGSAPRRRSPPRTPGTSSTPTGRTAWSAPSPMPTPRTAALPC